MAAERMNEAKLEMSPSSPNLKGKQALQSVNMLLSIDSRSDSPRKSTEFKERKGQAAARGQQTMLPPGAKSPPKHNRQRPPGNDTQFSVNATHKISDYLNMFSDRGSRESSVEGGKRLVQRIHFNN